jgi:hypothetical protein
VLVALLDTCVLWPALQRDVLLSLAVEGLYRPIWSDAVLAELEHHERRKLRIRGMDPGEAARRAAGLVRAMEDAFPHAAVAGWEDLDGSFGLPDADDEHVVAAAVVGGAGIVVTSNVRDFPDRCLSGAMRVTPPVVFVDEIVAARPRDAVVAIVAVAARSGRLGPRLVPGAVLEVMASRYGMARAAETLARQLRGGSVVSPRGRG